MIPDHIICKLNSEYARSLQFTGLLDKNGKEIYEGDIVRYAFKECNAIKKETGTINWNERTAKYCLDSFDLGNLVGFVDEYEVIGNIYENPELLQ